MNSAALEQKLGHVFAHGELLLQALTHRSHSAENNERLEFIGDGILNCVAAALLYDRFPALREGELSRLRASLVREGALAGLARELSLGDRLRLGEGETKSGGGRRPSMLADALEAVFGAIFLDAGYDAAAAVIGRLYEPLLAAIDPAESGRDPKTALQELLQGRHLELPKYVIRATRGEAHAQEFEVECNILQLNMTCHGTGLSRRAAEQEAARAALKMLADK